VVARSGNPAVTKRINADRFSCRQRSKRVSIRLGVIRFLDREDGLDSPAKSTGTKGIQRVQIGSGDPAPGRGFQMAEHGLNKRFR